MLYNLVYLIDLRKQEGTQIKLRAKIGKSSCIIRILRVVLNEYAFVYTVLNFYLK